ncbi:hypothetical protein MHB50_11580 [Siminovitchia sp. FSL H7-0308]|uniref:Uncharacterized protein n=1 Tax=Siminovitchia thermophila TaxID=1245522 RepID=A0ABS2RCJ9_9BACI|nr:hypothetical protein [Siminovitchia thermophila]MBM7717400.1 hypothetical protein [Siminovitchia thermophila]ONK22913.1 hypothetical protein BLX87_14360 [Bacillus sp. VT-16-64]
MLFRTFLYLAGFGFAVAGGFNIIAYFNLLVMGASFAEYILFILKRPECYLFVVGVMMISLAVFGFQTGE